VILRLDRLQPALAAMLCVLGVMTVFSAGADWARQIIWVALGAAVYVAATLYDYRRLRGLAPSLYAVMLVALLAVHLVGHTALGARRWLSVAGFPLEPSELSKLLLVIVLAAYLSRDERITWRAFAGALGLVAAPAALVLVQPDLGTTIVLLVASIAMLFLAGARPAQLGAVVTAGVVAVPLLPHLLHGYQRRRLEVFLDPTQDPLGAGYNLLQARIAVGSGGLFGRGWLQGLQGQLGFVPERTTDFVFATFAEEFGLLGSLVLLTLFGVLLLRLLRTASMAADRFGELLAAGVFAMILVQVAENVGMNIGVLPIAGIPLPLISYGGSATITTLAALGLAQSVMARRRHVVFGGRPIWLRPSGASRHLPMDGEDSRTIRRRAQA
jgi:rod shape determining protein RodA